MVLPQTIGGVDVWSKNVELRTERAEFRNVAALINMHVAQCTIMLRSKDVV